MSEHDDAVRAGRGSTCTPSPSRACTKDNNDTRAAELVNEQGWHPSHRLTDAQRASPGWSGYRDMLAKELRDAEQRGLNRAADYVLETAMERWSTEDEPEAHRIATAIRALKVTGG